MHTQTPKVSIVIPCYNSGDYIAEAVESALAQTYSNVEVVVVDDGSTDNSVAVLGSFGDRIRWETGPNRGACAARNRGVALATGEFVQFLDSDDLLQPDKLARHFESGDVFTRLTVTEGRSIDFETGKELTHFKWPNSDFRQWLVLLPLQTSAPLHRRDILLRVGGFREELPCCQEKDLHLRLAVLGEFDFVQLPFVGYTQRRLKGSISSDAAKVFRTRLEVLSSLNRSLDEKSKPVWQPLISESIAATARQLWNQKDKKSALRAFKRAREVNGGRIAWPSGSTGQRWKITAMGWLGSIFSFVYRFAKSVTRLWQAAKLFIFNHLISRQPSYALRRFFARRLGYQISDGVALHWGLFVTGNNLSIGERTVVNRGVYLDARGGLTIGSDCSIAPQVYILSVTHDVNSPRFAPVSKPTVLGNQVWIGARAIILPGVTINRGAVIGAGSIVTKDVAEFTIVAGNPARVIGERNKNLDYQLGYFPLLDTDITL